MTQTAITLTTAGSAVIAVGISMFVLHLQLTDRREDRRQRQRQGAIGISCWADWSSEGVALLSGAVLAQPVLCVANRTDEPVYGAFLDYRDQLDGCPTRLAVGTVPPGAVKSLPIDVSALDLPSDWAPELLLPALYFRDTRNRWWHRNTAGYLRADAGPSNDGFFESGGRFARVPAKTTN